LNKQKARHQFGGCNRLLNQYRVIGSELLRFEANSYKYTYGLTCDTTELREGLAFIPVEALEAYLEDLLDLEVGEDYLFIFREKGRITPAITAFAGLLFAICTGLYAASSGASLFLAFGLTLSMALPFAVLWHFAPREGAMRRMGFAQVLSQEISRRRGHDRDTGEAIRSGIVINRFLASKSRATSAQGAAFDIIQ
jgi:hypothetical protein